MRTCVAIGRHAHYATLSRGAAAINEYNSPNQLATIVPVVSHELNTALTAVLGNAHILRERGDELDPSDRAVALLDIETHAERLLSATQNLLLFARTEMGEKPYLQPTLLRDLLAKEAALEVGRRPDRRLRVWANKSREPVQADERLLKVLLRNLLENAYLYAGPQHEVVVALFHRPHAVRLLMLDRGPGIAEEERQRIFLPFYRSPSVVDRHPGLGLGLTVAQNIAVVHGGHIEASNRRHGGACFALTLPIIRPAFA